MKKKVVFFTGAGISKESGGKLFRGSGGLWGDYKIEDVCTPGGWKKDKGLVLKFYNERRQDSMSSVPNAAHIVIADLSKDSDFDVEVITQNVDDLHRKAGFSNPIHIHGSIMESRSTLDPELVYACDKDINIGDKCEKGSQLRPNVTWFGEQLPTDAMTRAVTVVQEAEYLVIVGTSLEVFPAASLIDVTNEMCQIYYVDPGDFGLDLPAVKRAFVTHVRKNATIGVPEVIEEIKRL